MDKQIKIALAGNPNCGKTTLFNALTGSNQFVGNWPGVTVEKKEGKLKKHDNVIIMDLPGIYSLSPYTLEEVVARNYLIRRLMGPSPWSLTTFTVWPMLTSRRVFMLVSSLYLKLILDHNFAGHFFADGHAGFLHLDDDVPAQRRYHSHSATGNKTQILQMLPDFRGAADLADDALFSDICQRKRHHNNPSVSVS